MTSLVLFKEWLFNRNKRKLKIFCVNFFRTVPKNIIIYMWKKRRNNRWESITWKYISLTSHLDRHLGSYWNDADATNICQQFSLSFYYVMFVCMECASCQQQKVGETVFTPNFDAILSLFSVEFYNSIFEALIYHWIVQFSIYAIICVCVKIFDKRAKPNKDSHHKFTGIMFLLSLCWFIRFTCKNVQFNCVLKLADWTLLNTVHSQYFDQCQFLNHF